MPYLLKGQIVKGGRPSSTKGSIGCVSLVYQLLIILLIGTFFFYFLRILKKNEESFKRYPAGRSALFIFIKVKIPTTLINK